MPQSIIGRIYHKLWSKTWDTAHALGFHFKPKGVFRHIYHNRTWGDRESVSGPGSELAETRKVREVLPALLRELNITSMLDAPCGDWNWMKTIDLPAAGVTDYTGAEVVPELVELNAKRFAAPGRRFIVADIASDPLPRVDLILCRDCLVHLANPLAAAALSNFKRSGSTWLLTTTYPGALKPGEENRDIATGQFRKVDLTKPPFNLPPPERIINEESAEGGEYKSLGLWRIR